MLYQEVEKREDEACGGVVTATGSCKFCGQAAAQKALEEWGQEEIDELVTETCECLDARIYSLKKGRKERADARIESLFGEGNGSVIVPDAAVSLLHEAVYPVCEGFIKSVTMDIGDGIRGKISITSKGSIKVERTKKDTSAYEA